MTDAKVYTIILIILICSVGYFWDSNENCKAKGGTLVRGLTGGFICVKEIIP